MEVSKIWKIVRLLSTNWTFCIAWLPVKRKKGKKQPSFDFFARQTNAGQLHESVCSGTIHCLWESLLMTWILGQCPSLLQSGVLISCILFYYSAQQNSQTYLANARAVVALCPVSNSLSSATKDMQLNLPFQGGSGLQFLFVLMSWALMVSSFLLMWKSTWWYSVLILRWLIILHLSLGGRLIHWAK